MNQDANSRNRDVKSLADHEVAELKAIAIMYHSRGRTKEAAAIFELLDRVSKPGTSDNAAAG